MIGSLRTRRPSAARRRCRVRLEELEPRTLLSVFTPAQIRQAYGFNQIAFSSQGHAVAADGSGQTIALVDAYGDPNVAGDLQVFDKSFGLPAASLTVATPQGKPAANAAWAQEISLDVQWAHAIAPGARLLLVEAKSDNVSDLVQAINYARNQPGVVAVSMSWAVGEFAGEASDDSYFRTPSGHYGGSSGLTGAPLLPGGVTFVAAAGDTGAGSGSQWPAVSPNVLGVGGTKLTMAGNGSYVSETAWGGGGGGISTGEGEPYFQHGVQHSGGRAAPDVAYAADPNSAFYVYDSVPVDGYSGWYSMGGTSAGAPQWAALVAIADQGRALAGKGSLDGPTQTLYALYKMAAVAYPTYFHDITNGSNGHAAQRGFDLVTGLGSPIANQVVGALINAANSYGNLTIAARTAVKAPPARTATPSVIATPVAPPPTATAVAPTLPHALAPAIAPASVGATPLSNPASLPIIAGIPPSVGGSRVLTSPAVRSLLGTPGPAAVEPPSAPVRTSAALLLESGGGDLLPVLDEEEVRAEPEARQPPAPAPGLMPPADPDDGAADDDGPGPCGEAAARDEGPWLAALAPVATALWERMDASPWALCSLAVPAGLALVVGSCAADPSNWEDEAVAPQGPVWPEWRRRFA